jgi:hypothetical protein
MRTERGQELPLIPYLYALSLCLLNLWATIRSSDEDFCHSRDLVRHDCASLCSTGSRFRTTHGQFPREDQSPAVHLG